MCYRLEELLPSFEYRLGREQPLRMSKLIELVVELLADIAGSPEREPYRLGMGPTSRWQQAGSLRSHM